MSKIRVGVVGLGHRGRFLVRLSATCHDVEIAAACDLNPTNWYQQQWQSDKALADLFPNAAFYEDYDRMLDDANLDVVIVETGADIHAAFCIKALEKNINVLTDIPCVANLQEAEDLWKASQRSKAIICTGANPNYQKFTYLLRDFYKKGLLGKPYCMEAEYIHWTPAGDPGHIHLNENGDWRKLLTPVRYCTHSLGPLLTVLEEELRKAVCFGTGQHGPASDYGNTKKDDMSCAQFQTASGVVVRFMKNGRCRAKIGLHNYRVFGTEGYMERIDRLDKPVIRYNSMNELDTELKEISGEFMPPPYARTRSTGAGHGGMDDAMLDQFFSRIAGNEDADVVTLRQGLAMTIPGIYAEASLQRGGAVLDIRYPWDADWTTEIK